MARNSSLRQTRGRRLSGFGFQYILEQDEPKYERWITKKRIMETIMDAKENVLYNIYMCAFTAGVILILCLNLQTGSLRFPVYFVYNLLYFSQCVTFLCIDIHNYRCNGFRFKCHHILGYILDVGSYLHLFTDLMPLTEDESYILTLACFYIRLHRPFKYLWDLNDYNLTCSVIYTFFKYHYIFCVLRLFFTTMFIWINVIDDIQYIDPPEFLKSKRGRLFYRGLYVLYKLFIPIGTDTEPRDDLTRILYMSVVVLGSLLVAGITIASLSLILSIYMRPEEKFRTRFRLIMNEMKQTQVPYLLSEKVQTFYRMYWYKQKAVSETPLMSIFPHTLRSDIRTNIYFESMQKSRMLRDLPYQLLSEIAKFMHTVNYVPGDRIIKRNSLKSAMIFITCGDVEMVTPEDDETATMRFTRGTILNPCGGAIELANTRAHVTIRAATFCSAHVLQCADLWRVVLKYGKETGQGFILRYLLWNHLENVKRHYAVRDHPPVPYKSTILALKRNLIGLKEARDKTGELLLNRSDFFIQIASCYSMRNRADTSLVDEADAICLRPTFPCILQPYSSFLLTWHFFVAFFTLIVAFVYPYNLAYLQSKSLEFKFFQFIVALVFCVDIIVRLSTGARIEEGAPISFAQTSSQQMRSYWFVLDVLSALPIFPASALFKLPRVFKLLKHLEDICVYQSSTLRFLSYGLLLVLLCYLVAAWQQAYVCTMFGYCVVTNYTSEPFWSMRPIDDSLVEETLIYSLYWSISLITFTSHKTAQFTKLLWHQQLFVMIVMEICVILYLLVEAVYSATIMVSETMREEYVTCIETVKKFLVKNDVDPVIQHRFINYLQLCWYTDKAFFMTNDENSIWFDLPAHVYQDILAMQRSKYILGIPFMKFLSNNELKNISSNAYLFHTSPNEILLNTGDISNEIYVIKQGFCEVIDPNNKAVVALIGAKKHFGDIECLLRLPAYYTVRAVTHVQMFCISRKYLINAMEIPKIKDAIHFAKQQQEYKILQDKRERFLNYEMPVPPPNREKIILPRLYEPDTAFLQPFRRLGIFSILRYVFPRFTIRPDGKYLRRYEWFRAACALASANLFPLLSFLELQFPWLNAIAWILDIAAYFDIVQRMLVGYYNEQGILVYHPASTAAHYMKGAFGADLMGCLPLEFLDSARKKIYFEDNAYRHPSSLQYFMYNRLVQLYRVPSALEILNDYIDRHDIILIIKAVPLFMALLTVSTSLLLECSVQKWQLIDGGYRLKRIPFNNSWIDLYKNAVRYNITETPVNAVLTAWYWIVYETTTTGFDTFQPTTLDIMCVLICSMIIAQLITTFFTVRIISIRSNVNRPLAEYQQHMTDIVKFMKKEKLDKDIQQEVVSYYEYMWDKTGGTDYRSVLKLCDQITLRTDAILHIYGKTFSMCPILHHGDLALLRIVGRAVHSMYFRQNMVIIEHNDVIHEMYFVQYGTIGVHHMQNGIPVVTRLSRGSAFGNLEALKTMVCPYKIVALSNVHLLKISTEAFCSIIQDCSNTLAMMKKVRTSREKFIKGTALNQSESDMTLGDNNKCISLTARRLKLYMFLQTHPKLIQIYLIIISMLCVYGDMYNASFKNNRLPFVIVLYLLDVGFLVKIILSYCVPNITDEELLTKQALQSSRKKYFSIEFKFDICSCLPLEIFCLCTKSPWYYFALLRLNRVFRVVTVYRCLARYHEKLFINLTITTMSSVFIWFTLFIHTMTCIWHLLAVMQDGMNSLTTWQYNDEGQSVCKRPYICAMYFVLITFTHNGVGDIVPRQRGEVAFVCILMILSTMLYIIYVGEFSNIIQYQYFRHFSYFSKYLHLQEFLKNNRVARNLVKITNKYTLLLWRESRGLQMPHFLEIAPECLRLKIMSATYMHHLTNHPVFGNCEPAFLRQLVGCFELFIYDGDMYVVKEGEVTNAMYFIHKGRVQEIDAEIGELLEIFNAGQSFGLLPGLKRDTPYFYSYKTINKSEILTLPLIEWEYLLKHFPKSKDAIYKNFDRSPTPSLNYIINETKKFRRSRTFFKTVTEGQIPLKQELSSGQATEYDTPGLYSEKLLLESSTTRETTEEKIKKHLSSSNLLTSQDGDQPSSYKPTSSATEIRQRSSLKSEKVKRESIESGTAIELLRSPSESSSKPMLTQLREKSRSKYRQTKRVPLASGTSKEILGSKRQMSIEEIGMEEVLSSHDKNTRPKIEAQSTENRLVPVKGSSTFKDEREEQFVSPIISEPPVTGTSTERKPSKESSLASESSNSEISYVNEETRSITSFERHLELVTNKDKITKGNQKKGKAKVYKRYKKEEPETSSSSMQIEKSMPRPTAQLRPKTIVKRSSHQEGSLPISVIDFGSRSTITSTDSAKETKDKKNE